MRSYKNPHKKKPSEVLSLPLTHHPAPNTCTQQIHGTGLSTRGEVTDTCYDTSGTRMATCTAAGSVHVWDRVDGADGTPG
jgi:hypothetical protein